MVEQLQPQRSNLEEMERKLLSHLEANRLNLLGHAAAHAAAK